MAIRPFTPQDRTARLTALVNAVVVILVPITVVFSVMALAPDFSNTGTTVRPPNAPVIVPLIQLAVFLIAVSTPFAMVVAWRTWVHAVRWETLGERGWRGVLEGGLVGFAVALWVLLPGIVTRPLDAPPYLIAYGGFAFVVGMISGLLLRTTGAIAMYVQLRSRSSVAIS